MSIYDIGLEPNSTNFQPLTPLTFLHRAATVYPDHLAIVYGSSRINYRDFYQRSVQLASALCKKNIGRNDTVSVMLVNTPAMLEAHYGVPMCRAVLHSLNTRLDVQAIAFQLDLQSAKYSLSIVHFTA